VGSRVGFIASRVLLRSGYHGRYPVTLYVAAVLYRDSCCLCRCCLSVCLSVCLHRDSTVLYRDSCCLSVCLVSRQHRIVSRQLLSVPLRSVLYRDSTVLYRDSCCLCRDSTDQKTNLVVEKLRLKTVNKCNGDGEDYLILNCTETGWLRPDLRHV